MEMLPPNSERVTGELIALGLSSTVLGVYVTEQSGARETFALMQGALPEREINVGGWTITPVSIQSPIGRRLQDASLAEQVIVPAPDGEFCVEVISVNGCPVVSPQERLRLRKEREEERQAVLAARWAAEQEAHQRRLQLQQEKATLEDLKRRRKANIQDWRQQIATR